jgi:hypothetical protein
MPAPIRWQVPSELSPEEARIAAKLAAVYQPRGTAPLPAAGRAAAITNLRRLARLADAA